MKILVLLSCLTVICFSNSFAADTLKPSQTLPDNGRSLVSVDERFEFGFFSLGSSAKRYAGIRYKRGAPELRVVWVANRDSPIADRSGVLRITKSGNILLLGNRSSIPIWSSNSSIIDPTLQLLNTGNLIVRSRYSENYAWQSIEHPQDTQIAGMKLGMNLKTGQVWRFSTWTSLQDPSPGEFTIELDPRLPQLIQLQGSGIFYRSPPWNGAQFGRNPSRQSNFRMVLVYDETQVYYTFETMDATVIRFWANPNGSVTLFRWTDGLENYSETFSYSMVEDECDSFAQCGPSGICEANADPLCRCPTGFVPRVPEEWALRDWSSGCVSKKALNSGADERFVRLSGLKLPYSSEFSANKDVMNLTECELICRRNSCVAYTVALFGGCVVWFGDLLDIRVFNDSRGQDLYVRVASSEEFESGTDKNKAREVIITVSVMSGFLVMILCVYVIRKRTYCFHIETPVITIKISQRTPISLEDVEIHSFCFDSISNATDNFSRANKIGHGGFGPVYKGTLPTGQQIAVKRLSQDSGQGSAEFKNEVILIAKLQHRNLVRLLGRCVYREERMLIYEYMPNKSLDLHIFDQTKETALSWQRRYDIIVGITRGLLYLHRDSRLRIIHRDLKASNILLDGEMNPKIADFGLAKVFGEKSDLITKRVIGTYGYMSPEYVIDGRFSVKSDVFSFGVVVLEIVSGKKNRGFEHADHDLNLLGHAWLLWNEGRAMEFTDVLMENVPVSDTLRCIQIGLLCVQNRPETRPLMSSVLSMFESNSPLPQPKQPGFYMERVSGADSAFSLNKSYTYNEISITNMYGR